MSNVEINDTEQILDEEDILLKKNKGGFAKFLKSAFLVIVLVLIADMCILLMLNKIGAVNINNSIKDIPGLNIFVNEQVRVDANKKELEDLKNTIKTLEEESALKDKDIINLSTENDALSKEIQDLREHILKLEDNKEEVFKLSDYYTKMKPKAAAKSLNEVKPELALEIFSNMKEGTVGEIMQNMDPAKVAKIAETYKKLNTKK